MASKYNFTLTDGVSFSRSLIWKNSGTPAVPVDLTGKTGYFTAKVRYTDPAQTFSYTSGTDANIVLGTTDGLITLSFTKAQILAFKFRFAKYDLFIDDYHLLTGEITIKRTTNG